MAQNYAEVLHFGEMLNLEPVADPKIKYSPKIRIICSYLYFMQGVIISLPATMTLMYSEVPTYSILSVFSAALLPFSFKFLQAPFIEKFTNVEYGKRKTWIITSQILASSLLFLASFLTSDDDQFVLAIVFLLTILCITLQDISLDAMSIKQLKSPHIVGLTQAIMQTFGVIVGGLVFLKASSMEFAISIGRTQRIADVSTSLRVISMFLLIPTAIIHFIYQQSILKSERKVNTKSLSDIIKTYRSFLSPTTKYCRAVIIFLICTQGFNPFSAGYQYELIQKGFLKNTINTIGNIVLIPITIFAIYISPKIDQIGWIKCVIAVFIGKLAFCAFILATFQLQFSTSESFVSASLLCSHFFDTSYFILTSVLINSFPVMGLSGMFITMMASCWNFGQLKSPSLALIGVWGWKNCSIAGLVLQTGLIAAYPWAYKWMMSGEFGVDAELMQKRNSSQDDELSNSIQGDQKKKRDNEMIEMVMMPNGGQNN